MSLVSLVFTLLAPLTARAHDVAAQPTPRLYNLTYEGRTSRLLMLDHSSVDVTTFEMKSVTSSVARSCELLFDGKIRLVNDAPFDRNGLSLTARDTLVHLGLGTLGTGADEPISIRDAWRKIRATADVFLTAQMDAYADAREHDHSLTRFGQPEINEHYHLAAQFLFETRFTNAALIEAMETWAAQHGTAWFEKVSLFRPWAEKLLPKDNRGATNLNATTSRSLALEKLDDMLVLIGELLPTERTAANFWNNSVSMLLRTDLRERYFTLANRDYQVIRATLDWADQESGVVIGDDAVTDTPIEFEPWVDLIMNALARGDAFVVVDPLHAAPREREGLLDRLSERGVSLTPVSLRGFRPQVVR